MRATGGAGGGTIVVDIPGTRAASTKVGEAAQAFAELGRRIAGHPLPEMPAGTAAIVQVAVADAAAVLGPIPAELIADAQELRVRALWAEIADRLMAGYALSGSDLSEFKAAYASGLIDRYAEPWERDLADAYAKKLHDEEHPGGLAGLVHDAENFFDGAWDAIKDPATMIYHLTPFSGGDWTTNWEHLGEGLVHGVEHPLQFAKAIVDVDALEQRGFSYWLGNLAPAVAATLLSGGAAAAVRGATGVTAVERAGLTAEAIEGLSSREAATVIMRGARPVPGMIAAGVAPVPGLQLTFGDSPAALLAKEARNFDGPVSVTEGGSGDLWLQNTHSARNSLLGVVPGRTTKYLGNPHDLLRATSEEDARAMYALPPDWGDRNAVSIVHIPEADRGWMASGRAAPQTPYGEQFVGGAEQQLVQAMSTSHIVWSGPPPWAKVPDVRYATTGAAKAAASGAVVATLSHPGAVGARP